ncbi:MAG: YdiU family protein [Pseudomonadota bacterium]
MTETLFAFENSYATLPDRFYAKLAPTPVREPQLIRLNDALAEVLRLDADALRSSDGVAVLTGNRVATGSDPLAMAYAGHQFGSWNPQLGDGRALLLGEVIGQDDLRYDIQLKGSGPTPYSRMGDGRAGLGPVLREYIVSEAMAALGVPTTRALAATLTGEPVYREDGPLPGAVLTRVSRAHIRVGTFQFFAARGDIDALRHLADHVIDRLYPDARGAENPYLALLESVISAQAKLIAQWMHLGFIHGVMNTDNMSIAGETIDYGPCAFMDAFHPDKVFSFIDRMGRYRYRNQPGIAQWNLANFAQSLLPLLSDDETKAVETAQAAVDGFPDLFEGHHMSGFARKIGLSNPDDGDTALIGDLLRIMALADADFTLTFRHLAEFADPAAEIDRSSPLFALFNETKELDEWLGTWRQRLEDDPRTPDERKREMNRTNPAIIPRNHLVEAAIQSAYLDQDFGAFEDLTEALATPFDPKADPGLTQPPKPEEEVRQTFCGT